MPIAKTSVQEPSRHPTPPVDPTDTIQIKTYEIDHRQSAQAGRLYYEPGKRPSECEHHRYESMRDYHVPVGNPNIEALLRNGYFQADCYTLGNPMLGKTVPPTPKVLSTKVVTVTQVGVQGTHTVINTESMDTTSFQKSQGGHGFDPEVIIENPT